MSKSFKNEIKSRYKGRGNTWVKVPKESSVYSKVFDALNNVDIDESSTYKSYVEREGFAWIRFSKAAGCKDFPSVVFEVRYKGSKIDHPECTVTLDDKTAKTLSLLGNTPVKLFLETDSPRKIHIAKKEVSSIKLSNKTLDKQDKSSLVRKDDFEVVKEAKLTQASKQQLKEWEAFLKEEGLLSIE
jgi:hypothetical protein